MSTLKLKEDLKNCIINFNNRIKVTDLLEKYQMEYKDVCDVLQEYMDEQISKNDENYDKRFIVHGEEVKEVDNIKEFFRIVEESKLPEWLSKLKKSTSMLYSVQIKGSGKSPPEILKPLSINKDVVLREMISANVVSKADVKVKNDTEVTKVLKVPKEQSNKDDFGVKTSPVSTSKDVVKKQVIKPKKSPALPASKAQQKSPSNKGLNKYFNSGPQKAETSTPVSKTKTSKPLKSEQSNKECPTTSKKATNEAKSAQASKDKVNKSIPLFDVEDDENEVDAMSISSNEEEKIAALRRDIMSSDIEMEENEEVNVSKNQCLKRRRIVDSDDENNDSSLQLPPEKVEKLDNLTEGNQKRITYLDEDDFVVTIRPKPSNKIINTSPTSKATDSSGNSKKQAKSFKSPSPKKKSPAGKKTSPKKSKQTNLMSFFKKK